MEQLAWWTWMSCSYGSNHWDVGLVVYWTDVRSIKLCVGILYPICRFQSFYHFYLCKITRDKITDSDMLLSFQCDHSSADFLETLRPSIRKQAVCERRLFPSLYVSFVRLSWLYRHWDRYAWISPKLPWFNLINLLSSTCFSFILSYSELTSLYISTPYTCQVWI